MADDDIRRVRLRISGRVQGVFYRAATRDRARRLGLAGWVRNRQDGTVEAVAAGPADAVQRFIEWCHEGSPSARVRGVDITEEEPDGELSGFDVRH